VLEKHPTGTLYIAWDNANTHEDDEVEDVVRLAVWFSCTYRPTVPGSTRSRCSGDIFAERSPIVNCLKPGRPCWRQRETFSPARIVGTKMAGTNTCRLREVQREKILAPPEVSLHAKDWQRPWLTSPQRLRSVMGSLVE
jgi:hypothetical protein